MHIKQKFIPALLLAAAGLSTAALAQPADSGPDGGPGRDRAGWHHRHGGPLREELRQLDLSQMQKAGIKQIVDAARPQMRAQREALHTQRKAFDTATPGSAAYQNAAANLAEAEAGAARARVQQQAALRTQIYALLTDAQKSQLANLIAQREARVEQWKANHPAPPPQG